MANAKTAESLKQKGNEEFKAGNFRSASELYAKAEKANAKDPVYPSNLSAALYETGDYLACAAAILRSWKLLQDQPEPKSDLIIRLSTRLAKALTFAVLSNTASEADLKAYEEGIKTLRERSFAIPTASTGSAVNAVDELSRAWQQWDVVQSESEERTQKSDPCLRNLSRLPIFMKPLDDAKEYYSIGHDPIIDLTAGYGSDSDRGGDSLKISKLPREKLSDLSFMFGGVGDGRHAFGTIAGLYQAYKALPAPKQAAFHAHLTLLDIHPTAIARDLCMLLLLHEYNNTTDPIARAEVMATLMYIFCAGVMPSYCYNRLMDVVKEISSKLCEQPPALPSWLHVEAKSIPTILRALDYWINTEKSTRKMVAQMPAGTAHEEWAQRGAMLGALGGGNGSGFQRELQDRYQSQRAQIETMFRTLSDEKLVQLPFMPPGIAPQAARAFLDSHMEELVSMMQDVHTTGKVPTNEQEWYRCTKTFLPPPELRKRHFGFDAAWQKLQEGEDIPASIERKIVAHIGDKWKTNITLFDSNYNNPKYHYGGDGYKNMTGDAWEPVNQLDDFNQRNTPRARRGPITNDANTLVWDVCSKFFGEVATAIRGLEGHLTVELIAGGLSEELAKMRYKGDTTRPANFQRKYTRMWLSNVPDYTHGPMNMAIYVVPNLQDGPEAGASCNCLLNTGSWVNDDHFMYNYTHLLPKDLPRFLGCRIIRSQAVMDVLVLGPLSLPRPLSELASRDELHAWLTRVLFDTFISGYTRPPPENVRLPHNLVAFVGLLMHLHRVGFPAHWLSDFLARVLSGSMVSDIPAYDGLYPIPLDHRHRRVASRRVRTDPWLVEFENIIATACHALPFNVTAALPPDFTRDPEDIQVWEARTTGLQPFQAMFGMFGGHGNPFEPATRLLFYKPSETSPSALVKNIRSVFEGSSASKPGTFFVLTAADVVQYDTCIRFRMSKKRIATLKEEKWAMVAFRQDTGKEATRPSLASTWVFVDEGAGY
ncbi:hypothetical protein GY45DRAFT_1279063 [Cubamyces sp. BRFM 1775]|nr:hypothetical protein GY45DRAFT_1279063 [Cubamyces sp. BRFM 1775]